MDAGGRPPGQRRADPPDTVGNLEARDRAQAAAVLAASLDDDPGFSHLFPVRARRGRELRAMYRMTLADGLRHGRVLVTRLGGQITGVLTLYPPGSYPMPPRRWLRQSGRIVGIAVHTREHSRGLVRFAGLTSAAVPADCWYVEALGILPDMQQAGRGDVLMRTFLADLDAAGAPSYLETTNERNVDYYLARGYTDLHPIVPLAPGGPHIHPMTRPAAHAAG